MGLGLGLGLGWGLGLQTPLAHGVQLSGCAVGQVVRWQEAPVKPWSHLGGLGLGSGSGSGSGLGWGSGLG